MDPNKLFGAPQFWKSVPSVGGLPPAAVAEVVFAGRSNAGKSSAINAVCGRRIARVGRVPGRTRMINYFTLGDGAFLLDLPGYGYAVGASPAEKQRWAKMIDACLARAAILILIADCRRGLTDADCRLLARFAALSASSQASCHILISKSDKLARAAASRALHEVEKTALACGGAQTTAQLFSALKKTGVEQARQTIAEMLNRQTAAGEIKADADGRGLTISKFTVQHKKIAILPDKFADKSGNRTLFIKPSAAKKQGRNHPDIGAAQYKMLGAIFAAMEIVGKTGERKIGVGVGDDGKYYCVVWDAKDDRNELVSFYRLPSSAGKRRREINRLKRQY